MGIEITGRWIALILGCAIVAIAALVVIRKDPFKSQTLTFVFSLAFVGLGIFGLPFMNVYKDWLSAFADLLNNPGKESYTRVTDMIKDGEFLFRVIPPSEP